MADTIKKLAQLQLAAAAATIYTAATAAVDEPVGRDVAPPARSAEYLAYVYWKMSYFLLNKLRF